MTALVSPLGLWFVASLLGLLLLKWRMPRAGKLLLVLGAVWLCVWSTPAFSHWLRVGLESVYPPLPLAGLPAAQAAVVLGGAVAPPSPGQPFVGLNAAADRVWHGARLYHAGNAPLLVLSGGSDPAVSATSEAEAMAVFLADLGVPSSAWVVEGSSRNTRQNAQFSAALLRDRGIKTILLMTSASHMARAVGYFQAEGLMVLPVAVDHTGPQRLDDVAAWLPDADALLGSARVFKEWVGLLAMRLQL